MSNDSMPTKNADDVRDALKPRVRKLLKGMWAHEEGARSFADPEGVHQMRVSSRKVRAALDTAGTLFAGKKYRRVYKGVRRLTRALGGVRDGDVLLADLETRRVAGTSHPGIDRLAARLEREREDARGRLLTFLDKLDSKGFREQSLDAFAGRTKAGRASRIRRRDARRMIDEHVAAFIEQTGSIPPENEIEALHEIRKTTKRLRYALQLTRKALKPESKEVLSSLTDMQDQLGEIHNLDVLIGIVRDELYHLADESLERATAGGVATVEEDVGPAWEDLLSLAARVAKERHERYNRFVAWWDARQGGGFRDALLALTEPRA